ncbi:MAG: hypothetical protein O8C59_03510 [Candidatus Methanoperedens sp.]|nr:hypothetical protein [Candidatus Methanoperedens sp.]
MQKIPRGLVTLVFFIFLIGGAQAAAVHGTIYAWSDFEKPLKNVIVEINSIPVQSKVASDGTYNFSNLPIGNYTIKARYYRNNILEYDAQEEVPIIDREGKYDIDLLLFPPTDSEIEYLGDINLTSELDLEKNNDLIDLTLIVPVLIIFSVLIFYWSRKKKTVLKETIEVEPKTQQHEPASLNRELPDDLKELYDMILKSGGRVAQKDLRKKMVCSEAKVSLMLDDLENRGLITKIKKGRSNIIIAQDKNQDSRKL